MDKPKISQELESLLDLIISPVESNYELAKLLLPNYNDEINDYLTLSNNHLLIYEEVYRRIPEARQSQLKAVEKTWNSYRDIHCQELSAPFREGSIYPLLYFSCRARVTNSRIADLQGTNISQITSDLTTQRLAKILKNEEMINSAGQRQWLKYQAQQCQFESLGSTETARSAKQCRDRLAEGRLLEIEAMLRIR